MLTAAGSTTTRTSHAPTRTVAFQADDRRRLFTHAASANQNSPYSITAAHQRKTLPDARKPPVATMPSSETPAARPTTRNARNASFAPTTRRADTGCDSVRASVPCSRSSESTLKPRARTSSGSR